VSGVKADAVRNAQTELSAAGGRTPVKRMFACMLRHLTGAGHTLFVLVTANCPPQSVTLAFEAASGPSDGSLLAQRCSRIHRQTGSDIVFAVRPHSEGHWYENFGGCDAKRINWHDGTCLCRLHLPTGTVTTILDDPQGGIRDPQVSYNCDNDPLLLPQSRDRALPALRDQSGRTVSSS